MALSDLPTIYDLTPDYAGNLAGLNQVEPIFSPGAWAAPAVLAFAYGMNTGTALAGVVWGMLGLYAPLPTAIAIASQTFFTDASKGLSGFSGSRRYRRRRYGRR